MAISVKIKRTGTSETDNVLLVTAGSADTGQLQIQYNGTDIYNNLSGGTADVLSGATNTNIYVPIDSTTKQIDKGVYRINFVASAGDSDDQLIDFQIDGLDPIISQEVDIYSPYIRLDDNTNYLTANTTVASSSRTFTLKYPAGSNQSNLVATSTDITDELAITTANVWTGASQATLSYDITYTVNATPYASGTYLSFTYQELGSGYEPIEVDTENTLCDLYGNINLLRQRVAAANLTRRSDYASLLSDYQYVGALMSQFREAITCNKTEAAEDIISQIKYIVGDAVGSVKTSKASQRVYGASSQITMTFSDASTEVQNVDNVVFDGATITDDGDGQITVTIEAAPSLIVTDGTTSVEEVSQMTFSGAAVTNDGSGAVTITITSAGSLEVADNTGLAIDTGVISTVYNTTIGDAVESVTVGGADPAPASTWKTKNIVQVLDTILFPTILASIKTAKSTVLTISGTTGIVEIGQTIARTLTATFNRGAIYNGDGTTNANPLVGAATQYTFTGTGISSTAQAGNTLAVSNTVVSGSNSWAVTTDHDAGTGDYFDNKGVVGTNLDASRVAGTSTDSASSPTVTGVYPYFYLKSGSPITAAAMVTAIENGTATKVVGTSTGTLSIPYNMSAEYLAVAYPSSSTTKTVYYVTALDNGAITVVFNAVETSSVDSPDAYWTGINYKIHTSLAAITNSNPTIELRNS